MATQTLVRPITAHDSQTLAARGIRAFDLTRDAAHELPRSRPVRPFPVTVRVAEPLAEGAGFSSAASRTAPSAATARKAELTPARATTPGRVAPAWVEPLPATVPSADAPTAVRPSGVRLTRRGRLTVFVSLLVLGLVAAAWLLAGAPAVAGTEATPAGEVTSTVVVGPGETLWDIARDVRPGADPRETVTRIQELNGLTTVSVWAGQPLIVPA